MPLNTKQKKLLSSPSDAIRLFVNVFYGQVDLLSVFEAISSPGQQGGIVILRN